MRRVNDVFAGLEGRRLAVPGFTGFGRPAMRGARRHRTHAAAGAGAGAGSLRRPRAGASTIVFASCLSAACLSANWTTPFTASTFSESRRRLDGRRHFLARRDEGGGRVTRRARLDRARLSGGICVVAGFAPPVDVANLAAPALVRLRGLPLPCWRRSSSWASSAFRSVGAAAFAAVVLVDVCASLVSRLPGRRGFGRRRCFRRRACWPRVLESAVDAAPLLEARPASCGARAPWMAVVLTAAFGDVPFDAAARWICREALPFDGRRRGSWQPGYRAAVAWLRRRGARRSRVALATLSPTRRAAPRVRAAALDAGSWLGGTRSSLAGETLCRR